MDRISALFHGALELPSGDRDAFLEAAAADEEPELLARVRALLEAHAAIEDGEDFASGLDSGLQTGQAAALLRGVRPESGGGEMDRQPGERVGRYGIVRRLGTGGMGAVYLAHDPVLDRHVALKFLPPLVDDPERLLEEARVASALDHPGIGTVYEVARDEEGRPYLAMASYPGGTLRDRLASGPLPVERAVDIAVQVADALHAAHERGVVHRDVKPENLVFDRAGRVKLVDFGIARAVREPKPGGTTGGTTAYMSPEHLGGAAVDGRADLWSLGVVLFEMLTGRRPFEGEHRQALIDAILRGDPPPLEGLRGKAPPGLGAVVARVLARDPAERFENGKALATALRDAVGGGARPPSALLGGRFRGRVGAGLAAAAVLAFLAGVLVARGAPRVIEASGWAGPAFAERGTVVVADFDAPDDLAELALAAREALVVDLQQSGFVAVAGRSRVAGIVGRMDRAPESRLEGALALEVAERAGAGALIEATVARVGSRYVLSARALRPASGEELFAVRTAAGERRLLGAVERLSREIRMRLGETPEALAASRPLPEVTTPSVAALRLYAEAERLVATDAERSSTLLDGALELDPGFAMAHRLAAALAVNRLRFSDAAAHLQLAWEHRERLPERERWHVEALHASEVAFEPWRAADLYERLLARFPDDARAAANLGATRLNWLADPEGARLAFLQAVEGDEPSGPAVANAVHAAFILDRVEEADALARQAESVGIEGFLARWDAARAFGLDDRPGTEAACTLLLAADLPPQGAADDREVCGSMYVATGELDRGIALLESVLPEYVRAGRHRNVAHTAQALAAADVFRGDTASARGRLLQALDDLPAEGFVEPDRFITRQNLRIQAALFGWDDIVRQAADRYPPYSDPDHWFGRASERLVVAAGAVHAGDGEGALEALDGAFPAGVMAFGWRTFDELLRGYAFEALGEPDLAAIHFERAADRRFAAYPVLTKDRMNIPLAVMGLERVSAVGAANGRADEGPGRD